jgi:DNA repair exonuclease SbcCD ATPase subunit
MLILEKILNKNAIIKYLYHISDIHIRRYEKHNEFKYIFEKLYVYLQKVASEDGLIVITGDLLHNKDNLTPDCINITWELLRTLSCIMPVILITGNHDFVETNHHIKDSINAILKDKQENENIYYLRESGAYKYGNICFGVSSLIDKQHIYCKDINTSAKYKIGLYHGPVGETETSVGFKLRGDKIVNDFIGYDYVLLGDIHKFQYIDKNMAYASSLISQNFSEVDDYHGVLVWDLVKGVQNYKIIKNKYRYMDIIVKENNVYRNDNIIDYKSFDFPKNGRLRINIEDSEYYKVVKKFLKKSYNKLSIYESTKIKTVFETDESDNDISYLTLLDNYIIKLNEDEKNICRDIFSKTINDSNMIVEKSLLEWKLLDLEFSNLFTYGSNNIINFTKLQDNDITGLFAPNSYGKSTIIDIILLALYDDFSRNVYSRYRTVPSYIVNNKYSDFEIKLRFTIGPYLYVIHKKGKIQKKNTSKTGKTVNFSIYKLYRYEGEIEVDMTGKDRFETIDNIVNIIGTYEEFCLTTLFLQSNEKNFYDMKPQDRKNFLYKLLHLHKFESMTKKYKNIIRENKILLKSIESQLIEYKDYENLIEKNNKINIETKNMENEMNSMKEISYKFNIEKEKIMLNIDNSLLNYQYNDSQDISILKKRLCLIEKLNIKQSYYKYNFDEFKNIILEKRKMYEDCKYKISTLEKTIEDNKININCDICLKRKYIYDNLIKEYDYSKEIKLSLEYDYDNILNKIMYLDSIEYPEYNVQHNIESIYNNYIMRIKYKENVDNMDKLLILNKNINDINENINLLSEKIMENKIKINNNKHIIENYNNNILLQNKYCKNIRVYECLAKSVCIHGIPSVILKKYLSGIEEYMNNLISNFIKRKVKLVLDGNYLYINIYNDSDEIIKILGGMEHFIVNISLKITLGRLSVLPKCGLMIIDEGVSVLDKEHIDKFEIIANFLRNNYTNTIIISHIDAIKDSISDFITINKVNGDSIINY